MAEKQLAYRVSGNSELFADDDPLAELARIVGFESRPAAPAAQAAPRQEPAFNLEDELLQEFERYDTPSLSPADDVVLSSDDVEAHQPHHSPAAEFAAPASDAAQHVDPSADDFAAFDRAEEYTPLDPEPEDVLGWQFDEVPVIEPVRSIAAVDPVVEAPQAVNSGARDLIDELEASIAPVAPAASSQRSPQWAAASIRLPLANFNTAARRVDVTPEPAAQASLPVVEAAPEFEPAAALGFPAEQDRHEPEAEIPAPVEFAAVEPVAAPVEHVFDLAAAAEDESAVQPDAALTEAAYADEPPALSLEIDDLLDDVSRYPVPERGAATPRAEEPVAVVPPPQPVAPVVAAPAPIRAEPQAAVPDADDPFAGHDFELDLEGIELELADFDFPASKPAPAPAPTPAPAAVAAPVEAAPVSRPAPVTPAIAAAAVAASQFAQAVRPEMANRPATAAVAPAVVPVSSVARPALDDDQPLPFDPSEISDTGERVETFEGTHVPALPHTDHEEPVAIPPEFDFDIDAEMANLFGGPAKAEVAEPVKPAPQRAEQPMPAAWAKHAAQQNAAPVVAKEDALDEFERALEEDFRRSVREASGPTESATRMTLESASAAADRRRVRSMRGLAAGVAAIVVLGLGVYGIREWTSVGGSSLGLASGQPRVIAADTDPVKIVPEDPGGKIVPNQDKAVYDRVAGDSTATPKQKELVSSAEQPVDVVQKTLETEAPDESDNPDLQTANATPVGETEDPRLLPNHDSGADAAASDSNEQAIPSVSPRKVRTMIVKPDGTLVAREDSAPAAVDTSVKTATSPATAAASSQAASASLRPTSTKPAPSAPSALAEAANSDAASAESTPIRVVKTTKTEPAKTAPTTAALASASTAAAAATPAAAPEKPVAAATAPEKPKAQPAATQVAAASPATQPVKAAPAASAGAGAYAVQIASLPSEAEAKKSQAALTAKFASVIGGHSTEVKRADIAGKGTYYRVRVVASSKDEAADICVRLRQAGGTCLISK